MLLSIITINYNDKEGLARTMNSVLSQTYTDFEYIVIDGGSNDGSKTIIEQHQDQLGYWVSEPDSGIYNAMNKGIAKANGEYILFLNSGDVLIDDTIIKYVCTAVLKGQAIYYGDLLYGTVANHTLKRYPNTLSFNYFFKGGYLPHPSSFIKRNLFERIGLYNENYQIISDWSFFVKAICKYNVGYTHFDKAVSYYDVNGISANPNHRGLKLKEKQDFYQAHFLNFIEDYKDYNNLQQLFGINRFHYLRDLEHSKIAKKLNSAWLLLLKKIF